MACRFYNEKLWRRINVYVLDLQASPNHQIRFCRNVTTCKHCHGRHHTLLCKRAAQESAEKVSQSTAAEQEAATINDTTRASGEPQRMVWLSTAVVLIRGSDGEELPARALLDQGSQSNFITERLAQQLKLKRVRISSPLSGIDDTVPIVSSSMVVTRIRSRVSEFQVSLQFLVLLRVTSDYPSRMVEVKRWNLPLGIPLADPAFNKPERIDMLIGARLFADLLQEGRIKLASYLPQLLETRLGWIVSGRLSKPTKDGFNESIVGCAMDDNFNAAMERLVQLEDIPEEKLMSDEEQLCERWYAETTRRNEDGRYIVQLPKVADYERELGESYEISLKRFGAVERRKERDECLREEYHKFMEEYIQLGHMTRIADEKNGNQGIKYYLPHHAVLKLDSSTTKCRVVFDGSCRTDSGKSLNDILLIGPQLQDDIVSIMMRFIR
ncbi:uncharacterized protein LOC118515158 [Anopheles stephensi]|uniref:uncharacterized protein LOC118515158 n=1 Tax=Anopheles stephensi TaxID=30069 RepID=UPI001658A43E|nr:uncharacterized protein LOC118515158 [Anopheles stephensi]